MSDDGDEPTLRLDEKMKAADELYSHMFRSRDRRILAWSFGAACALHVVFLLIDFPAMELAGVPDKAGHPIPVRKYLPPPPTGELRAETAEPGALARRVPIPDPTPDDPEPIREPGPEIEPGPLSQDIDVLIGEPVPPPPPTRGGVPMAGVGGITKPVRIDEGAAAPVYPELARRSGLEAVVTLQVLVRADGTVGDVALLRSSRPAMGFEAAAIEAVRQWRYRPALREGRPVDAYYTVSVEFKLD